MDNLTKGAPLAPSDVAGPIRDDKYSKSSANGPTSKKKFSCQYCGMTVNHKYDLTLHIRRMHEVNLRFICELCPKAYVCQSELKKHMLKHQINKHIFKCHMCAKGYGSQSGLDLHLLTHKEFHTFQCTICLKKYKLARNLNLHIKNYHSVNSHEYKCLWCPKTFATVDFLREHERVHRKCPDGVRKYGIDDKIYIKGPTVSSKTSKIKTENLEIYNKVSNGQCFVCYLNFNKRKDTMAHLIAKHLEEASIYFPFKCTTCDYIGPSKDALKSHMDVHKNEKNFKCTLCDYAGVRRLDVKRHMAVHSSEKTYMCNICGKKFDGTHFLNKHKNENHNDTKFPCNACGKTFRSRSYLLRHIKSMHSNGVLCDICGKTLSSKEYLVLHIKRTHSQKPSINNLPTDKFNNEYRHLFECFLCGDIFTTKLDIQRHCKTCQLSNIDSSSETVNFNHLSDTNKLIIVGGEKIPPNDEISSCEDTPTEGKFNSLSSENLNLDSLKAKLLSSFNDDDYLQFHQIKSDLSNLFDILDKNNLHLR